MVGNLTPPPTEGELKVKRRIAMASTVIKLVGEGELAALRSPKAMLKILNEAAEGSGLTIREEK